MSGLVVGLTGGIGSGKSAAAELFAKLGATVVDTDAIAHELTGPQGAAVPAIASEFGKQVLTAAGALDRAAMRQIVFSNPQARLRLEHILHPMIRQMAHDRTAAALLAGAPYVLLVVPLLIEAPEYRQRIHRITVVDCDDELRIARVMSRSGLTRQEVMSIMAAQASRSNRLAIADDVVDNSGDMAALAARVGELHQHYQAISPDFLATG